MRSLFVMATLLPLLQATEVAAQGAVWQERLDMGRRVAETWCVNCHLIDPGAHGPAGDAAPPFQVIARMPSTTEMSLRAFLQTPHAPMPDYRLSGAELDGVTAWILKLKDH